MILDKFIARLSGREKVGAAVMTVVILVYLVDLTVINAVVDRLATLTEGTKSAINTLRVHYATLKLKPEVETQYNKVRSVLELPLTDEEIVAETQNRYLGPWIKSNNLQIVSMESQPSALPSIGSAREYVTELNGLEGQLNDVLGYIDDLNKMPGLFRVTQIHLTPSENREPGDSSERVKGSMVVARLVLRTQTAEPDVEPEAP